MDLSLYQEKGMNTLLTPWHKVYSPAIVTKLLVERGILEGWDWDWDKATGAAEGWPGKVCMPLKAGYLLGDRLSYERFQQHVLPCELQTDWTASRIHISALGKRFQITTHLKLSTQPLPESLLFSSTGRRGELGWLEALALETDWPG